jgi:hypothetical protein
MREPLPKVPAAVLVLKVDEDGQTWAMRAPEGAKRSEWLHKYL